MSPPSTFSRKNLGLLLIVSLLSGAGIAAEPVEPIAGEGERRRREPVDPAPPPPLGPDHARRLERLEVARRRRPGMGEDAGDRAGAHLASGEVEADQDPPPRRMG